MTKPQVNPLQALDSMLDRHAALVSQLLEIPCFPSIAELKSAVEAYGARFTQVNGIEYVIKNNRQREHIVEDIRAMNFWLREVVPTGGLTVGELKQRCSASRIPWRLVKRIAREQGWYVVGETHLDLGKRSLGRSKRPGVGVFSGSERVEFVGYEMDWDLRYRLCEAIADVLESGVSSDSPLVYQMVSVSIVGRTVPVHSFELCLELVKSGFYAGDVELG
jgi:hypothetical protein